MSDAPISGDGGSAQQQRLFDDDKDPQAFRTIGEVSAALGIKPHVLRYWEEQFAALEPVKRSGGRRYYRPEDIALLQRINALIHEEGYTIRGAAKALSGRAVPLSANAAEPAVGAEHSDPADEADADDISAQLREIRASLAAALI